MKCKKCGNSSFFVKGISQVIGDDEITILHVCEVCFCAHILRDNELRLIEIKEKK